MQEGRQLRSLTRPGKTNKLAGGKGDSLRSTKPQISQTIKIVNDKAIQDEQKEKQSSRTPQQQPKHREHNADHNVECDLRTDSATKPHKTASISTTALESKATGTKRSKQPGFSKRRTRKTNIGLATSNMSQLSINTDASASTPLNSCHAATDKH